MMNKRRINTALLELILVILFFALAAGMVVRVFMASYEISRENGAKNTVLIVAQDTLEQFKAEGDSLVFSEWDCVSEQENKIYQTYYDSEGNKLASDEKAAYFLHAEVSSDTTDAGILHQLQIGMVAVETNSVLFELQTGRYRHIEPGGSQ